MPKVSVIVPVYNSEKYLSQCLESIGNQSYGDIEIICINDGSTDESAEILNKYASKDKRIKVINQKNKGQSAARNAGLEAATGKYISFIDSDDVVDSRFFEILYTQAELTKSEIACCGFVKIYDKRGTVQNRDEINPTVYNNPLDKLLSVRNFIQFTVWNKLYRRDLIKDFRFVEDNSFEDWVFNCGVFANVKSLVWVSNKLYGYRISDCSIMRAPFTVKKMKDYAYGIRCVYEYYQRYFPQFWEPVKKSRVARSLRMMMSKTLKNGDKVLYANTAAEIKDLYKNGLIGYAGLSPIYMIRLYKFLHSKCRF